MASPPRPWLWPIFLLAILQATGGILGGFAAAISRAEIPGAPIGPWVYLVQISVFAATASWLLVEARGDPRADDLAALFLIVAASFSRRVMPFAANLLPTELEVWPRALNSFAAEAFQPYFLWAFFSRFPRGTNTFALNRLLRVGRRTSLVVGLLLLALNVLVPAGSSGVAGAFARDIPNGPFWLIVYGLSTFALPVGLWRTRTTNAEERRRVRVFVAALGVGLFPTTAYVLLVSTIPGFLAYARESLDWIVMPSVHLSILLVPLGTAYAVVVDRVFDARSIMRSALRYAVARGATITVAMTPFLIIFFTLFGERDRTIAEAFSGYRLAAIAAVLVGGLIALQWRDRALDEIDRRFFREHYDAHRVLGDLIEKLSEVSSRATLYALLLRHVREALHIPHAYLLSAVVGEDGTISTYASAFPGIPGLDSRSSILELLSQTDRPIALDAADARFPRLPAADRAWIRQGDISLMLGIFCGSGDLQAALALGPKANELPYSTEDHDLLRGVAHAASLALDSLVVRASPATSALRSTVTDRPAKECSHCGLLFEPGTEVCTSCDLPTANSVIPLTLWGKLHFQRRIGAGATGVVYRAMDVSLSRTVAVKTLPRVKPELVRRLHREARTAASVSHAGLAQIFGLEMWQGLPLLVFEYLEAGTLADRLTDSALEPGSAIALGLAVAQALERVHGAGVLHRDIKPSNIGYSRGDVPKLLDFGLAGIIDASLAEASLSQSADARMTNAWVGTPLYMSPEALRGEELDFSFDLWSLCMVVYEAIAGTHPLSRPTMQQTTSAIALNHVPDIREAKPLCPEPIAKLLGNALSPDRRRRPKSAHELVRWFSGPEISSCLQSPGPPPAPVSS